MKNEKFTEKYGVSTATIYKGTTAAVKIPGPDHPLYDKTSPTTFNEAMVAIIDRTGTMKDAIWLWSDPDHSLLWVLDGRGRWLNVEEANRRRAARGAEPVQPYLVPFSGTEREAVEFVRIKNYHRRVPKLSDMATDILVLRKTGCTWDQCAASLNVESKDPEQWARALLPLAYCVPEVQEAFDTRLLPLSAAKQFGGSAPDGSKALGKRAQVELLATKLDGKKEKAEKSPTLPAKARERVVAALRNGASETLNKGEREIASAVAATIDLVGGDKKALKGLPEAVADIITAALQPLPKGPKTKKGG